MERIVYWMTSARRTRWNHALEQQWVVNEHNVPLIVVECLASDIDGQTISHTRFARDDRQQKTVRIESSDLHPLC